ncbi:MAG TPA: aldehyde dehydrogenase family protein [Gammaproteobacteria bacterium]|nr:aldehyde dehydrogenase family protein [Gammaproteobacteria bacterium]
MNLPFETPLYIAGAWRTASGPTLHVYDPRDESVLASIASATADEVHDALFAARAAQRDWARRPAAERGAFLRAAADLVHRERDRLARLVAQEVGKPLAQAYGEIDFAAGFLRYNAEWDRRLEGEILPGDSPGETIHLLRVPLGVVAAICPWNFPLAVLCRKLGPALVTGNTIVIKPSEISPLATLAFVQMLDEHLDLPPGVVNLVTGARETGQALVDDPQTSLVSFTGHRDTGKEVMRRASARLTRVSLELGGKAPAIVWKDADLDLAVPAIIAARHTNCGQVCTAAERVLVHRDLLEPFTERYVAAAKALRVGDPLADSDLGPLVSAAQHAKTSAAVALARREGAKVLLGGGRPEGRDFESGYWFAPTVLRDVTPAMSVMIEETFGPVTPIVGIDSIEEALSIANASRYGLSAYLFSRDYGTVMRTVNDLDFGEIYINRTLGESIHAHHAGYKESGIGGEDGKWGLLRYTQVKTAYHHYGTG